MKNTPFEPCFGSMRGMLPQRMRQVMECELTPKQYRAVVGYYFEGKTLQQLADEAAVCPSTVWRTLQRGLLRLARCLRY